LGGVCIANGSRTILNSDDWCGVDLLININKVGSPFRILLDFDVHLIVLFYVQIWLMLVPSLAFVHWWFL
jgi:hypothetical protein